MLGDVGVDDGDAFVVAVAVAVNGGEGLLPGCGHLPFVAQSYMNGELEGGHAAGVQKAGPGAFAVGAGVVEGFFRLS
ncbi:hypothetical protein [Nonomuraea sp. NPDC003214]